jgi:hypothetical protein
MNRKPAAGPPQLATAKSGVRLVGVASNLCISVEVGAGAVNIRESAGKLRNLTQPKVDRAELQQWALWPHVNLLSALVLLGSGARGTRPT